MQGYADDQAQKNAIRQALNKAAMDGKVEETNLLIKPRPEKWVLPTSSAWTATREVNLAFESTKEQLKEQWADLSAKIQESSTFNNLREKFESQTPTAQRGIVIGLSALAVLFLLSFPYGYYSASQDYMNQFEENRGLIKGLLKASRSAKTPSPIPPPLDAGSLRGRVDAILRSNRLLPEQMGEIIDAPQAAVKEIPATVVQTGVVVQIKKLNVKQMVALSTQFQNMGSGTKLIGLDIVQSAGQTHYYDMIAKIVNFGLPQVADAGPEEPAAPKGKRPARPETEDVE